MSTGKEQLHRLQQALGEFEQAVVQREHRGLARGKVALQQEVDKTRATLVKLVVDMVTEAKLSGKA